MSPFALRSALVLAAAVSASLLTSCSSTVVAVADDSLPADIPSPVNQQRTVTVSPAKARAGARPIQYAIYEITVPEKGGTGNFLTPHLRDSSQKPGPPVFSPFPSLRELTQIRGVELIQSGKAREGQTLRTHIGTPIPPYPIEFSTSGKPLTFESKRIGTEASVRGEVEENGAFINIRGSFERTALLGFTKYPIPSGAEVLQPKFSRVAADFSTLRIPNGGFAVLTGPVRSDVQYTEDSRLGGLLRTKSTRTFNVYFAIGVSSGPGPALTAGTAVAPVVAATGG